MKHQNKHLIYAMWISGALFNGHIVCTSTLVLILFQRSEILGGLAHGKGYLTYPQVIHMAFNRIRTQI
jgi:hypothetical protein